MRVYLVMALWYLYAAQNYHGPDGYLKVHLVMEVLRELLKNDSSTKGCVLRTLVEERVID